MDDMAAFEEQIASVVGQITRPPRSVDAMSIMRTATTTSPRWRLGSMFPAARFVVAGVIVALFGGFLLAGVLTQPTEDPLPAAVTDSPGPTDGLLPGVDLVTEEVEPGLYRVLSDGVREIGTYGRPLGIRSLTFGRDGSLWAANDRALARLGSGVTIASPVDLVFDGGHVALGPGGLPWVAWGDGCDSDVPPNVSSFDGDTMARRGEGIATPVSGSDPRWPPDYVNDLAVGEDEIAWIVGADCGDPAHERLLRLGPDGWTVYRLGDGLPMLDCPGGCAEGWNVEATPDGSVWLGVPDGGLLRFDGSVWEVVRPLGGDEDHGVISLAANRDGVLWAEIETDDEIGWRESRLGEDRHLARFDGRAWDVFPVAPVGSDAGLGPGLIQGVGPDGTVWLTDANEPQDRGARLLQDPELQTFRWTPVPVSFDGERWRAYPQVLRHWASDPENGADRWGGSRESHLGVDQIAIGPDGTAWLTVGVGDGDGHRNGLYVITPGAAATRE